MRTSSEIDKISEALSLAQGAIENAEVNAKNPHFKSEYADLSAVINAFKKHLSKFSIAVVQIPSRQDSGWILVTRLSHSSGQWIEGDCPIISTKQDAQGFGSGLTYARRYSLSAMIGIAQEDDDGNEASKKQQKPYEVQPAKAVPENVLNNPATMSQIKGLFATASQKGVKEDVLRKYISLKLNKLTTKDLTQFEITSLISILKTKTSEELNLEMVELETEKQMEKEEIK